MEELIEEFGAFCEICGNDKPEYTKGFYGANFCNNCYENGYANILCQYCKIAFWTNDKLEKEKGGCGKCLMQNKII